MPNDYMNDGNGSARPADDTARAADREENEGAETATLPKSILMGKDFEVGDEVVFRITHMGDDEIAVEYAPEPASDESEKPTPEAEGEGQGEGDQMMNYMG